MTPSIPRAAVVSTAVPPASSGQARVLGQILALGSGPPPVWFSDRLDLLEPQAEHYGRHVGLCPARFLLKGTLSTGLIGAVNNIAGLTATVVERARQISAQLREDPEARCARYARRARAPGLMQRWLKQPDRLGMPANPPLSVIVPVYNGELYIAETLASILGQLKPDDQLIVVDDGSTDGTPDILSKMAEPALIISQANAGESAAVNRGVSEANSD